MNYGRANVGMTSRHLQCKFEYHCLHQVALQHECLIDQQLTVVIFVACSQLCKGLATGPMWLT